MTIRFQLFTCFLILISVFVIDFFINQRLSNQVIKNTSYLNNSETVIRNSNVLHKEMIEMQSGFRGFLLTGQEVFLQPYYEGLNTVPGLLKEQKQFISSLRQSQRLDSINRLHQKWIAYANSLITTRLDTFPEASIKYRDLFDNKLRMEVGKKLNDRIQKIFLTFDNDEYALRQERRTMLAASIERTRKITLLLTVVSIIIGLLSSLYVIRSITRRIALMVTLAEEISEGNFRTLRDVKQDELTKLSVSLNSMSKTLEKSFNELDQFAYIVSHDLKAPLRGIANLVSWLEEDHEADLTPEIKRNLELIKGRTSRLENMINGLLDYARIRKTKTSKQRVDLNVLLPEIIDLIVPKNFKVAITGSMPILTTEKLQIEQVFSNLISNAFKYNPSENAEITVSVKELDKFYSFSVSDNGPGIEKEYFEKIFIIFQTLQERDAFESTGVGLAIVKNIVEEHKGIVTVSSELNKGSVFSFTWPKN